MRICITLDDVLRAKTEQICKIYKKKVNPEIELEKLDLSNDNLQEVLGFKNKEEYNKFLYEDYSFEVFAEASTCEKTIDKQLNLWHIDLSGEHDDVELILSNPFEFNQSIGYTYFFLSKIATRIREVNFPSDSSKIWDLCDVLITANNKLLNEKPDGKKSIKISTDYNKDTESDFTYNGLSEFLNDKEIINKLKK